ncbi:AAA family ATPase [Argonema galeatum]|uniref:AAA family ATPase n=1 Tax=Argonema galeatum TaxID=2942762 RepID=UPI00201119E0|nr:AAA family ATPase [Argonema galeatum]MCL1463937.1 AAA family ATPase [Argonema galeatum A003/A1]
MQTPLPYQRCQQELEDLLRSQYPLIFLRSAEETRAVNCAIASHQSLTYSSDIPDGELARWSSNNGFQKRTGEPGKAVWEIISSPLPTRADPIQHALGFLSERLEKQVIENLASQHTYILPDWSTFVHPDSHFLARQLKELIIAIDQKRPRPRMSLIVIGSDWQIPSILRNSIHILDLPLPIGEELYQDVFRVAVSKYNLPDEEARRLAEQAQGMPLQAASQTAKLITTRNLWEYPHQAGELILEVKKQEIRKTGGLEYFEPQGQGLNEVGGLQNIKDWIVNRQQWFEQDVHPQMRPRAILLEGYPGCGKTFIARAIAQQWRVPQINFEISRLQSKWVGESESNTFQALRAIEASAPNILFMDEIEKAFAGIGGDTSGVNTRQFGTFLSWLNDHQYSIFFIATSNNRNALPAELFRAGRFDEIFIIMPPNTDERREIIRKRSSAYKLPLITQNILTFLVENSNGFSGAELDKLVKEAKYLAGFGKPPTDSHWRQALKEISPQYKSRKMQELLRNYRQHLEERGGKPASVIEVGFWESLIVHG